MQTPFKFSAIAVLSILLLSACHNKNTQGKFVPSNAAIAVHFDGASLSSKLPWDEIKQSELFKQIDADTTMPPFIKQVFNNPDSSGINIKTDLLFFVQTDSLGNILALTGSIKDDQKFSSFCQNIAKDASPTQKESVNFISKAPICIAWNKERFLFINSTSSFNPKIADSVYPAKARDLLATCQNIFDTKENNSLGDNEKFTALVKKPGDIHFWINTEQLTKNNLPNSALAGTNINKMYEGSLTTATLNFEQGKILIDATSYTGKELSALYKKFGNKNIDDEMIKSIPAKDIAAVFAFSFKPEGIKEFLKLLGVDGYANMGFAYTGFSLDDFIKANKGDVVIALSDFKAKPNLLIQNDEPAPSSANPQPDYLFATSIGDKDAFNLLIKAGEKFGKDIPPSLSIAYNSNGKYFAIGNNKTNIDKYISGSSHNNFDFLSKISGNPFGGYINLSYILKYLAQDAAKDSTQKMAYDASIKMWDNIFIKGGHFEEGGITQSVEINLVDKNTNSLKQLTQYLGIIHKLMPQQKKSVDLETLEEPTPEGLSPVTKTIH